MVSRRSIRVKVMQLLYALDRDPGIGSEGVLRLYNQAVDLSFESLMFNLYLMMEISHQAVADRDARHGKLRPDQDDKDWNAKLYDNALMQSLVNNQPLQKYFKSKGFSQVVDQDLLHKMYNTFSKTPEYRAFVLEDISDSSVQEFYLSIYRELRKNEIFEEIVDDQFTFWQEDKTLVIGALKKIIKQLPVDGSAFFDAYLPDAETVTEYGKRLLETTIEQDPVLTQLIEPTLQNWDMERLAILDVILIKMALSEFLYFPTIPTKVTLDEYVDISKEYSTPKSKDFVNGILDKLMKSMTEEGKIKKEGRGLLEE